MADTFLCKPIVLTSTSATTIDTVPTTDDTAVPLTAYTTALIKSMLVSEDSGNGDTSKETVTRDSAVFGLPHATQYDADTDTSFDVTGNTEGVTYYYEHETGVNQVRLGVTTAIPADIT